ncbi:site-specific DNA-methyltransferase [Collibacillus ludicampi]|uniref:Site-specific DNA-methyltransferase n=1 Tax=Collibacillus ludicampi TaxID=2771369 RepID=A0AAV4LIS7_9BACL|nr:site-specific DNA-methyltransferase [Collibacillus ludicampi]GIM47656.1 site-specific DNA-methyltransferase [Collibacillus ludicampi]
MATQYDHLSREELIALLLKRDATRKLGLVWERDELEADRTVNDDFVTFELVPDLSIGSAPYENFIIEGDNFDALRHLNAAFRGKVKCIYIDPPYNTGNKDFIYNDQFVDKKDAYRHSKWLEFVYRRLLLARELLAEDGVILVSIDDDNRARLDLLMEEVFPGMRVGSLVWRKRNQTNARVDYNFSCDHEHVLVYAQPLFRFNGSDKRWNGYTNWDEQHQDYWTSGDLTLGYNREQRPNLYYPLYNPVTDVWYPCDPNNVWRFASKNRLAEGKKVRTQPMEDLIEQGYVYFPDEPAPVVYRSVEEIKKAIADGSAPKFLEDDPDLEFWVGKRIGYNKPRFKRFAKNLRSSLQPLSSWIEKLGSLKQDDTDSTDGSFAIESGYTSEGTKALREFGLDTAFNYPKPVSLIRNLIDQCTGENDIVVDFFAGSGTTAQAVLELNYEQGTRRRFILVSSTEATKRDPDRNVCRDVCQKRIQGVVERLGLDTSVAYFRMCRIPVGNLHLDLRHDQVWLMLQEMHKASVVPFVNELLIQVCEGTDMRLMYIPSLTSEALDEAQFLLTSDHTPTVIYSWQPGLLSQRIKFEHVRIEKIPEYLLERFGGARA